METDRDKRMRDLRNNPEKRTEMLDKAAFQLLAAMNELHPNGVPSIEDIENADPQTITMTRMIAAISALAAVLAVHIEEATKEATP